MRQIDTSCVPFVIRFTDGIPEIDHESFWDFIANKESPMYLWESEAYDGSVQPAYDNRTLDELMRSDDIEHLYYMNIAFGFRGPQIPFRAWYNRDRNILITTQTKAGSRSVHALMHLDHMVERGWETITHFCDLIEIQKRDPETHSCLRDPMARYSSYLRMACKDSIHNLGFMATNPASLTHMAGFDNHCYPQHLQCLYRVDAELADSIPVHWKSIAQRMLDPTDPLGIHHLFELSDFAWLLYYSFTSWRYKAEIFDPDRIFANPKQKFYWVWDTDHDKQQYGMMQSLNRAIGLWTPKDVEEIQKLTRVTTVDEGTNSLTDPFTGKYYNTKQFISDNLKFFQGMKKDHYPDYAWMDKLHFENTPDNKPQYVL